MADEERSAAGGRSDGDRVGQSSRRAGFGPRVDRLLRSGVRAVRSFSTRRLIDGVERWYRSKSRFRSGVGIVAKATLESSYITVPAAIVATFAYLLFGSITAGAEQSSWLFYFIWVSSLFFSFLDVGWCDLFTEERTGTPERRVEPPAYR